MIDRATASVLAGVGGGLQHLGRLPFAAKVLTVAVRVAGHDDQASTTRLAILNRLGVVLKTDGRLDEAAACYAEVLGELRAMPEAPAAFLAVVHHNLAGLAYAREELDLARALIDEALLWRDRAGAPLEDVAADRGVLGAVLAAQHRDGEARAVLHEVLATVEGLHGVDHYEVAVVLHNLAALERRHDPVEAERLYERALAIKRRRLGPRHREVAVLASNLAALQRETRPG
jgi:tetratricopeptide (TPR) repeat protein